MRVRDYEYQEIEDDNLSEERKEELRSAIKEYIRGEYVAHYEVLSVGEDDEEYAYLYKYLESIDVTIRGIDGATSMEVDMFELQPRNGKSKLYKKHDEEVQEKIVADLKDAIEKGDKKAEAKCRKLLIENSTRLTKFISQKYLRNLDIEPDDKEMMGMMGLLMAGRKYDPTTGFKFSTYAFPCIYRAIQQEYYKENRDRNAYKGKGMLIQTIRDLRDFYLVTYGDKMKDEDISKILGIDISKIKELNLTTKNKKPVSYDGEVENNISIDRKINNLNDSENGELYNGDLYLDGVFYELSDEDAVIVKDNGKTADVIVEEEIATKQLKENVNTILSTLTDRENKVLRMRFGIDNNESKTLVEVGIRFGVGKERIRQIEAKALRKLRHESRVKHVRDFLD